MGEAPGGPSPETLQHLPASCSGKARMMTQSLQITSSAGRLSGDPEPLAPKVDLGMQLQGHGMKRFAKGQELTPWEGRRLKLMDLRLRKALPGRLLPEVCALGSDAPLLLPAGAAGLPFAESCSQRQ